MKSAIAILVALLGVAACRGDDDADRARAPQDDGRVATAFASGSERLSPEELESGRMNMDWRRWVTRDTTVRGAAGDTSTGRQPNGGAQPNGGGARTGGIDESWEDITAESVNGERTVLPVSGDVAGPSVLRVQILLDRALFSPGIIDGRWGSNTEKAVYWLQEREGLEPTGEVDERTWERLGEIGGSPAELVRGHRLTEDDVSGPFVTLPEEYYDRRNMDCQCYESLAEKLAERFHASEDLLRQLNPDVDLNGVRAGETLQVPAVRENGAEAGGSDIARLVVSDGGRYLHALDGDGRILYHFPTTLGSDYSPSPTGDFRITNIAHDPTWHYQPELLEGVDDDKPDAVLPAGPNNAVGVVWMQLSKPHYGIHGTSAPETIGYATSSGCVRLTNWDAEYLSHRVGEGTPVEFRDVTG